MLILTPRNIDTTYWVVDISHCVEPGWLLLGTAGLAMDYTEWTYNGMIAVAARFQNQDQFWIAHQKIGGHFFNLFEKSKNKLVWPKTVFWQF